VNRPLLSVRATRETLPESDVTVTFARSTAALSGPVTRPRITSVWADAVPGAANAAAIDTAAMKIQRRELTREPAVEGGGRGGGNHDVSQTTNAQTLSRRCRGKGLPYHY
jgi:hypothetical protein